MDRELDALGMLDLMVRPAFCVQNHVIIKANPAAEALLLREGAQLDPLLETGCAEYSEFSGGSLYLTLRISGSRWSASVSRVAGADVFVLEEDEDRRELQAMALAARELRTPLSTVMTTAQQLLPVCAVNDDPQLQQRAAQLNRGLYQMLRIIGNMTDAQQYTAIPQSSLEMVNITPFLREIFDGAMPMAETTGITLEFTNLPQDLYLLADREKLERAVLNMLSNALKFTPVGGRIEARVTQQGKRLSIQVQNTGDSIPDSLRSQLYSRYLRQPGLEDSRFGIGLGMVLIRSAAAIHGGAVLIDQPQGTGTRITLTLAIRQDSSGGIRSPRFRMDYAGERNHTLVELSDTLPASLYDSKNAN